MSIAVPPTSTNPLASNMRSRVPGGYIRNASLGHEACFPADVGGVIEGLIAVIRTVKAPQRPVVVHLGAAAEHG